MAIKVLHPGLLTTVQDQGRFGMYAIGMPPSGAMDLFSFGPWKMGADEEMITYISSANIAGGFHAGDPHIMRRTVAMAKEHGVAVGIHSGYNKLGVNSRVAATRFALEHHLV